MRIHDIGVARQIGLHSDAIECRPSSRLLLNLVKICSFKICRYVISASDMPTYVEARTRAVGRARATSTSLVRPALVRSPYPAAIKVIAADAPLG
jgi:hypothetical protein